MRECIAAIEGFEEGVSHRLGLGRTDLRCVDFLERRGPVSAGEIAQAMHLSSGATTFLVDRLEHHGVVVRTRDSRDRRRVLVELTPGAREEGWSVHAPLAMELRRRLEQFGAADLEVVLRFLRTVTEAYVEQTLPVGEAAPQRLRRAVREIGELARASEDVHRSVREMQATVREAQRDVRRSAREAQRDVRRAAREVQRELHDAFHAPGSDSGPGRDQGMGRDPEPGVR